jgi:hypothetical protein
MKANELRSGNYVDVYKGDVHYGIELVNNISSMGINERLPSEYYAVFENPMNDELLVKPIPLTEDWLLRLGFEKTKWLYVKYFFGDYIGVHVSDFSVGTYTHKRIAHAVQPSCMYVHQLQNLYFALTGEELTLKQ